MPARIKPAIFNKFESVLLFRRGGNHSTYAGFNVNPWLPVEVHRTFTQVKINRIDWQIEPSDWEIISDKDTASFTHPNKHKRYKDKITSKRKPRSYYIIH